MTNKFLPEALFENGFSDLIPVTPPGAQLAPSSKLQPSQCGKVPGRRLPSGLWAGFDWRKLEATVDDVRQWCIDGANVGLRADRYPGVDIDCTDERLAQIIRDFAFARLGPAPVRTGRHPKKLLVYRAAEPFSRMRLWIERGDAHHLVEILGQGQQYLVCGTHPGTLRPYEWDRDVAFLTPAALRQITREQADAFLTELKGMLEMVGAGTVTREGDGRPISRVAAGDQTGLLAPSLDVVRAAVTLIPNTNDFFPDRTSYLTMGYAIRAAAGDEHEPEAFEIFAEWAARWEGNGRASGNDPEVVIADWRRLKGPYAVGWGWLAEQARQFGFNDAALEFEAGAPAPEEREIQAPLHSDQWLAQQIVARRRADLRYVPAHDRWLVWQSNRWKPDAVLLADSLIATELRRIADGILRRGATPKEMKESEKLATAICSAGKVAAVRQLIQCDPGIALEPDALDHNPWLLNTPAGMIDLKTGKLLPANPDELCTRSTHVPADFSGAAPQWRRFLAEATGGDVELERYLQRFAGYCLSGSTREQVFAFAWGPGGTGKGVFQATVLGILADYARMANMDTFTASTQDRHSTDLAMLQGARLVTASETQAGRSWDEARVKGLTGGDPVTARFMRQDFFTFQPQFKLLFFGNHKPEIRNVGEDMRRRVHLVPFVVTPAQRDNELHEKLREEWPAILAWLVEGCLAWQREGLAPPAVVLEQTRQYFEEEDAVGRFVAEMTEPAVGGALTAELWAAWQEWAHRNGEHAGTMRRLSAALSARGYPRWRHPESRRMGFGGVAVKAADLSVIA